MARRKLFFPEDSSYGLEDEGAYVRHQLDMYDLSADVSVMHWSAVQDYDFYAAAKRAARRAKHSAWHSHERLQVARMARLYRRAAVKECLSLPPELISIILSFYG